MKHVLKIERMEGPWWKSWLAIFGVRNHLDKMASLYNLERERGLFFYETNDSLRERLKVAVRGEIVRRPAGT